MTEVKERESFLNRKRPAVEGLVEPLTGPTAQLPNLISQVPPAAPPALGREEPLENETDRA